MRAAVCRAFGAPLTIEDLTLDAPRQGEVRVRLAATAICHSDIHVIRGEWGPQLPVVAGHEAAGIVEEIGPGVASVSAGERVVVSLLRECGVCALCRRGEPWLCQGSFRLDRESPLRAADGAAVFQGTYVGAFAEAVIVDQSQVARVPADVPLDQAALLACGVITGFGSAVNVAPIVPGDTAVVIGAGGVGLNAIQGAAIAGAGRIIALDLVDAKLAAARTFGATDTVNTTQDDAVAAVRALTDGLGADVVLVTVGSPAAAELGLRLTRPGGALVIAGLPRWKATMALPVAPFAFAGQRILGSHMGAGRLQRDIPRLLTLAAQGRLKLAELITARYPLAAINEAIAAVEAGAALRNVIVFEAPA